jgi:hypothetical protein
MNRTVAAVSGFVENVAVSKGSFDNTEAACFGEEREER